VEKEGGQACAWKKYFSSKKQKREKAKMPFLILSEFKTKKMGPWLRLEGEFTDAIRL